MSVHDRPHMVYEGSRPRHLPTPPFDVENAGARCGPTDIGRGRMRYDTKLAIALSVAGALGLGVGIGVWMTPMLGGSNPFLAPRAETAPLATRSLPSAPASASVVIDTKPAIKALIEAPTIARVVTAPAESKPAARPARPQKKIKVAPYRTTGAMAARTAAGCSADGSRAMVTLCADPTVAAADQDLQRAFQRALRSGASVTALRADQQAWVNVREEAARRSPSDLVSAYDQRITDLNAVSGDPPR